MPISLGLYFNPLSATTVTGSMPKGWNFNYNQKLSFNLDGGYQYVDGNGCIHQFLPSLNNPNIYYDMAGTGLILSMEDDYVSVITDGYGTKLEFLDLKLRRISRAVYQDNGTVKEYALGINYDSNNNITTIQDISNATPSTIVEFDYSSVENKIIIFYFH